MQAAVQTRRSLWFLGIPVIAGAGIVYAPQAVLGLALAVAFIAYVGYRGGFVWWDLFIAAMGACLVLGYGFANIGIYGLPIADVLLLALLLRAKATFTAPFVWGAIFIAWACARLLIDYPEYGTLALRDFTLPVEMLWAVVGFWMVRFGEQRWINVFRWVFVLALVHAITFQWEGLTSFGPTVGLDQAVPLFGNTAGLDLAVAAGAFFFLFLKPFGRFSYVLALASLGVVFVFQARGLYILVPATFLLLWLLASGSRWRLMGAGVVGVGAVALVLSFGVGGRLDTATTDFYVQHFSTLLGQEGPGSGTIRVREQWAEQTLDTVESESLGWLTGVGLGEDLIGGFVAPNNQTVRKPHNDYLEIFARYGVIGLIPFLLAIWIAFKRTIRTAVHTRDPFVWWLVATAFLYLGIAAVQPILSFPFGTMPLFVSLGAGLALYDRARRIPPVRTV